MKIKFVTLNIFNSEFLARCIDFIKKENPGIFVLQEVYDTDADLLDKKFHSLEILKQEFKNYFYYYSPAFFREFSGYKVDSGNAIFSRFEIVDRKTVFYYQNYKKRPAETVEEFSLTPRHLQHIVLSIDGVTLNVFNTQGVWGLDGKDNKERLIMSRKIIDQIKDKKNVILAGDMNVDPKTETIKNIERYLNNVFKNNLTSTFNLEIKKKALEKGTYIWKNADLKGFASAVVDMIFVSPNFKVVEGYCPQVDISDHLPLVAVLEI